MVSSGCVVPDWSLYVIPFVSSRGREEMSAPRYWRGSAVAAGTGNRRRVRGRKERRGVGGRIFFG